MGPLLEATRTVPIVFAIVPDPVGSGYVKSPSRPGGNATGFMMFEYSLCGKWPALFKGLRQARREQLSFAIFPYPPASTSSPSSSPWRGRSAWTWIPVNLSDVAQIERELVAFAQSANGAWSWRRARCRRSIVIWSSCLQPATSCNEALQIVEQARRRELIRELLGANPDTTFGQDTANFLREQAPGVALSAVPIIGRFPRLVASAQYGVEWAVREWKGTRIASFGLKGS
jgi:hypothetical protein